MISKSTIESAPVDFILFFGNLACFGIDTKISKFINQNMVVNLT